MRNIFEIIVSILNIEIKRFFFQDLCLSSSLSVSLLLSICYYVLLKKKNTQEQWCEQISSN